MSSGPSRPSSQHKGDLFAPERQRTGKKKQAQEIEEEEAEENKGKPARVFVLRDKGLLLDRGETDMAHRQMVKWETLCYNDLKHSLQEGAKKKIS